MKSVFNTIILCSMVAFSLVSCKDEPIAPIGQTIEISEDITQNQNWTAGNIYIVNHLIRVSANITIEPGTVVRFKQNAGLDVAYSDNSYATIRAIGTPEKPILFSSASPSPAPGDHQGLNFYKGATGCEFAFCIFEFGGSSDWSGTIYIEEANVKFTHNVFKNAEGDAIIMRSGGAFTEFTNNVFENIQQNPVSVFPKNVHTIGGGNDFNANPNYGIFIDDTEYELDTPGNYTWLAHNAPYVIKGEIRVGSDGSGVTLTLAPGAILKFANDYAGLAFSYQSGQYGKLIAEGTPELPIVFTSNSPAPANGDWRSLYFYKGSQGSSMTHCEILYAGSADYWGAVNLHETGSHAITMNHCRVAYSKGFGITAYESSMNIETVVFANNQQSDYVERNY